MKTIILHVQADPALDARLQAALDLVRSSNGHLVCVQATPLSAYVGSDPFGGVFVMGDLVAELNKRDKELRDGVEARLQAEGVSWSWVHMDGDPAAVLVEQARLADLVIMSRTTDKPRARQPLPLVEDVALHARAPVLAIPPEGEGFDATRPALIAWNGSNEAASALRAAMPLLRQARDVKILVVGNESDSFPSSTAALYLSRQGIEPEIHVRAGGGDVAEVISAAAVELGAGYIVMGAYGHSRLREFLLGGVTRSLLSASRLPLLLAH